MNVECDPCEGFKTGLENSIWYQHDLNTGEYRKVIRYNLDNGVPVFHDIEEYFCEQKEPAHILETDQAFRKGSLELDEIK